GKPGHLVYDKINERTDDQQHHEYGNEYGKHPRHTPAAKQVYQRIKQNRENARIQERQQNGPANIQDVKKQKNAQDALGGNYDKRYFTAVGHIIPHIKL